MSGTLIRLFLVEGNPNGLRTVELSNKTIYATIFPRTKLKRFLARPESIKPGCYILLGKDLEKLEQVNVYIGESENVGERLKSHAFGNSQKEFWDEVIVFTSKDDYITKTQIRYLESAIHSLANRAGLVHLVNTQIPVTPNLSEVDNAEMEDFLKGIRLILSSLGMDMLESKRVEKAEGIIKKAVVYQFNTKGASAKMRIDEDQFVVLKGSTAVVKNRKSAQNPIIKLREDLVAANVLQLSEDPKYFIFSDDYAFNSPSYAAAAISGGTENGRKVWKANGVPLSDIEERELSNK